MLFVLHETGIWFAPGLPAPEYSFCNCLAVDANSLVGIFLLILYFLVAIYSFQLPVPLVYSLIGVVLFVIGGVVAYSVHHRT